MVERAHIIIKGVVQGVGFRPFVYKLATDLHFAGYVTNTSDGVLIEVEGTGIPEFVRRLRTEAPPLSDITDISSTSLPVRGYPDFSILPSIENSLGRLFTHVSPDVSTCEDCLREMLDPNDRRYLYPFINCTNCGPRYSITRSVPYDRPNTTMAGFALCPECLREYHDPGNRRFHAQPNACHVCGPQVEFRVQSSTFNLPDKDRPFQKAISLMKQGGIVAIKGIGGFHLACDATNDDAVRRLRERKRKSNKPFAVMSPSMDGINLFCAVSPQEEHLLKSNRRPVVLLQKNVDDHLSNAVSPNNRYVGVMLPYTPLHHLLFTHPDISDTAGDTYNFKALVMTSGNLSEEPIVRANEDAVKKLSGMADGFLFHNRDIFMRVDDSVARIRYADSSKQQEQNFAYSFIRRSRGYAPGPIALRDDGPEVLGVGADLKNTFTLTKGRYAISSQHIGDMENYETMLFYEEVLNNLKSVYRADPRIIVHDLHPGYMSTKWAKDLVSGDSSLELFTIQHHYAHIGSVMAEHGLTDKIIGVAFDGTGYGADGNLWGGEFIVADAAGYERVGQFKYIPLPGGEAAIRDPWKTAVSYIFNAYGTSARAVLENIGFMKKYGEPQIEQLMHVVRSRELSPLSSGAGRLFDAISALIGVCDHNTFEGEAAMTLESLTRDEIDDQYVVELEQENSYTSIDFKATVNGIVRDMSRKMQKEQISTKFHNTIASIIRTMVLRLRDSTGISDVALSGGTFQNLYLLQRTITMLSRDGMNVYTNAKVPCNDACISLGQAYLVRQRRKLV